ncbi:hypothetical protein N7527_000642 [Penicillium freii]|nr:hypothetical protein N7527_000642 [Penicillium freii]
MAIKDDINTGLLQSRLKHPVRDIAHSCALLHDIGHALEDSGPSGLAGRRKLTVRNVKCKTSSPMFIPYSVPTLYILKPTVMDSESIPCVCAPFLLAYRPTLTSHEQDA